METTAITLNEFREILNYTIDNNNDNLAKRGVKPIALNLVGEKGIGKTSILKQVAEERGMTFVKLNVAQLDEVGDIVGFPVKEYEAQLFKQEKQEDGNIKIVPSKIVWGNEQMFKSLNPKSYKFTGNTRMGYAKPAWVPGYNENGVLLDLDDFTRATPVFLNAMMDLILEQKYVSWSLPKKTMICLTTNPDNGNYNVSASDSAQEGRYLNFTINFNLDDWGQWAEKNGIDGRAINFALSYGDELFKMDEEGNSIADPRSFVMFANMISGIKNWDTEESLRFINNVAKGCFHDDQNRFGAMFTAFIRNKMHLLMQPKQMLLGGWDTVRTKLESTLYDSNEDYRADIASVLERRFSNYVHVWLDSDEDTPIKIVKDRILDFIRNEKTGKRLFNEDLFYHMIKTITSSHKGQTGKLMFEPEIAAKII